MQNNLLLHINVPDWDDLSVDKSREIESLDSTKNAIDKKDSTTFYRNNAIYPQRTSWGYWSDLLYLSEDDLEVLNATWFRPETHGAILIYLLERSPATPNEATTLSDLEDEFPLDNNTLFGLYEENLALNLVWDEASFEYFISRGIQIATLLVSYNQIVQVINQNKKRKK
jgi:hypothetical protein